MKLVIDGTEVEVPGGSGGVTLEQVHEAIDTKLDNYAPQDVYSTEETRIGTWIDGKPLYRKVVSWKGTYQINATRTWISLGTIPLDAEPVSVIGAMRIGNATPLLPMCDFGSSASANFEANNGNLLLITKWSDPQTVTSCQVIFKYTKTSDEVKTDSASFGQNLSLPLDQPPMPVTVSAEILHKEE